MTELGIRLSALREEKGLTQKKLARLLNMSNGTISNYENNVHSPDPNTLCILADFYQVTTDYLLGRTDFRYPPELLQQYMNTDYVVQNILNTLISLDSASLNAAEKYLHFLKDEMEKAEENPIS